MVKIKNKGTHTTSKLDLLIKTYSQCSTVILGMKYKNIKSVDKNSYVKNSWNF